MGILYHALGAFAMVVAIWFHPFPWTSGLCASIGGYLREQQYIHGKNKVLETLGKPTKNSYTLEGSIHKWLEALGWGIGAATAHSLLLWVVLPLIMS